MKLKKIDHVGIVVKDMAAAKTFFVAFGFELTGEGELEGELLDQIIGLENVKDAYAYLRTPDGEAAIELIQFYQPTSDQNLPLPLANTPGIRHIAFVVEDIEAMVAKLQQHGAEAIGKITNYENSYKLVYLRGPEGIILELAEAVK